VLRALNLSAWVELTKPRITMLLLITCVTTMLCADRGIPDLGLLLATAIGLALSSGGASALNHVLDRDIDARMARTATRPIPTGKISPTAGATFGVALMAASFAVLVTWVNTSAAVWAFAGGAFYVIGYTAILKRWSVQNIVIGGAAGAAPPLVGWAAVTGHLDPLAWVLFAIIFMWTPPHFWALALLIQEDYAKAGVPMMPVVHGARRTVNEIWWYTLGLAVVTVLPIASGDLGVVYAVAVALLDAWLLMRAWQLRVAVFATVSEGARPTPVSGEPRAAARQMFLASMGWLALVFIAAPIDRMLDLTIS
jgi:protoheme IX farnesyltransferase